MDSTNETDARIIIDALLKDAGWDPADKLQVVTEFPVKVGTAVAARTDYVLLSGRGRPLAVIEAKRSGIEPYTAKQQALPYAKAIEAPFIFLSNGELIYFWD